MVELSTPEEIIPAATVVVFRHSASGGPPELLLVQRAKEMRFAGGMVVFPGGRVDPQDAKLATRIAPGEDPVVAAAKIAGIRETLEETGLAVAIRQAITPDQVAQARELLHAGSELETILDRFGWDIDIDALTLFAHWCPNFHRAFDTRFFLTNLGTGNVEIAADETENTRLFWASAQAALDLADQGEISMIFPTRRNLERLALFADFSQALEHARVTPVSKITPYKEMREGEQWLMIPEGLGYPVLGQPIAQAARGR